MWKRAGIKKLLRVLSVLFLPILIAGYYIPGFFDRTWSLSDVKDKPTRVEDLLFLTGWNFSFSDLDRGQTGGLGSDEDVFKLSDIWSKELLNEMDTHSDMDVSLNDFPEVIGKTIENDPNPVPAPGTIFLLGSGVMYLAAFRRKPWKKTPPPIE